MSLHPQVLCPIPEETARVARAAYPKGNVYLRMRDELGTIYKDESFAHLFPHCGQLAEARLSFAAGVSDAICRGAFGSASSRSRSRAIGLEVYAQS